MRTRPLFPWIFLLLWALPWAAAAEDRSPAGTWEGTVLRAPAEVEIDVVVDLASGGKAGWSGRLAVPAAGVAGHVLAHVAVEGRTVTFEHADRPARGRFRGTLSDDGERIEGDFAPAEGGDPVRFVLRRRTAPAAPAALPELETLGGPEDLRARFNFDQSAPRLLLLLAPTCETCRIGARLTERYVLDAIPAPALRVYVVWLPMSEDDTRETARQAAGDLPDPRVHHFWVGDRSVADAFADTLSMVLEPAWDVFLVYPPGATWTGGKPPAPRFYMHRSGELPADLQFNAKRLADAVRAVTVNTAAARSSDSPGWRAAPAGSRR